VSHIADIDVMGNTEIIIGRYKKVSRNMPGVAQRVTGGLDSQIFMTFGT
jgi:hypothetical protein